MPLKGDQDCDICGAQVLLANIRQDVAPLTATMSTVHSLQDDQNGAEVIP